MDAEKTGKLIRQLRKEQNMTQEELASVLNVSKFAVSKWENGHNLPDAVTLEHMTRLFNVSLSELLLGERKGTEESEEDGDMHSDEDNKEMVIQSLVRELAEQGKKPKRIIIMAVAAVMLFLSAWLITESVRSYRANRLSWDLSGLQIVKTLEMEEGFVIAGKRYEPYTWMDAKSFDTLAKFGTISYTVTGNVIAYRGTEGGTQMNYYMTVGTMVGDWLLMYRDDHKTGKPSAETALYLYCTAESKELAPDWLKMIHQNE